MKTSFKLITFIFATSMLFLFTACGEDANNNKNEKDSLNQDVTEINEDNLITYLVPSPKDMFAFTKKGDLKYSANVLNAKDNADKYIDTKSQEIGFGIYSADLAYTAAFNQTNTAGEYLKVVESLSDKIGLGSVFTESLINRFKKIENKDSLLKVTNDTYYDIVKFLENNDRNTSLSLISVGGWVESLYIVTNLQNKYQKDNEIIQLIADQKNIFENIVLSLQQREADPNVADLIQELQAVKTVYDGLEVIKIENPNVKNAKANQIIVGGSTKIVMTETQFNQLKKAIADVRNKLAGSDV
ncbi:MAG: hypothetical protein DRI94_06500 [Bacteroidetes bacterium]|nr:MAG: hypothetical protein DRI94_06500 [Bacteroidota bacterium]